MREFGIKGELSKIDEEVAELKEAHDNRWRWLKIIESSDVVEATCQYSWRQNRVPAIVLFILYYFRRPYKFARNKIRDFLRMPKT